MTLYGDLLFGEDADEELFDLFFDENLCMEYARKVLEAIINDEMRDVITTIQKQVMNQDKQATYVTGRRHGYAAGVEECILFDRAYYDGLFKAFCKLLQNANPGYELADSQPIGTIILERTWGKLPFNEIPNCVG